VSEYH